MVVNGSQRDGGPADGGPEANEAADSDWSDPSEDRIEPGSPTTEHVAFVILGALGAMYVIARMIGLV